MKKGLSNFYDDGYPSSLGERYPNDHARQAYLAIRWYAELVRHAMSPVRQHAVSCWVRRWRRHDPKRSSRHPLPMAQLDAAKQHGHQR